MIVIVWFDSLPHPACYSIPGLIETNPKFSNQEPKTTIIKK